MFICLVCCVCALLLRAPIDNRQLFCVWRGYPEWYKLIKFLLLLLSAKGNNNRILWLATLTSVLTRKSNARLDGPHFGQIPHCTEQTSGQIPGVCPVWWAALEMTCTLPKTIFSTPGCCFSGMRMLRTFHRKYLSPLAYTSTALHPLPTVPQTFLSLNSISLLLLSDILSEKL